MTIEEPDKVDMLGIDKETSGAVLGISDHMMWDDEDHIPCLERKIERYLDFIKSGQLAETLPETQDKPVRINLVLLHEPTDSAQRLLQSVKRQLADVGVIFSEFLIGKGE